MSATFSGNDAARAPERDHAGQGALAAAWRTYVWSVRRELWEHRAIVWSMIIGVGIPLVGLAIGVVAVVWHVTPQDWAEIHADMLNDHNAAVLRSVTGLVLEAGLLVALVVGLWHGTGALYGERRDRTILFWKSMPVSDTVAVLAKASVSLLVLPVLILCSEVVTQILLAIATAFGSGLLGGLFHQTWMVAPVFSIERDLVVQVALFALLLAPLFAWALLVSAAAPRSPGLVAIAIPVAIMVLEWMLRGHSVLLGWLGRTLSEAVIGGVGNQRLNVTAQENNTGPGMHFAIGRGDVGGRDSAVLHQMLGGSVHGILVSPSLWIGLCAAAAFIAAAIPLRRRQEPF